MPTDFFSKIVLIRKKNRTDSLSYCHFNDVFASLLRTTNYFLFLRLFKSIERNTSALLSCKQHRRRKTLLLHSKYVIMLPFVLILASNIRVILIWLYFNKFYFWCTFKYVQDGESVFTKRWRTDTAVDYLSKLCQPRDRQFWHFQYLFKFIISLLLQFWRISLFPFICWLINLTLLSKWIKFALYLKSFIDK